MRVQSGGRSRVMEERSLHAISTVQEYRGSLGVVLVIDTAEAYVVMACIQRRSLNLNESFT
jgi:hypothetical protein